MYRTAKILALTSVIAVALASPLEGQRSGAEIWGANCGRCHLIQPVNRYDAKGWEDIGLHMAITARLTSAETTAVIAFLKQAARRVAALEELEAAAITQVASVVSVYPRVRKAEEIFKSQCAVCHGDEGKGDGIAASAYDPKPADMTDPEFAKTRTLEQIIEVTTNGTAAMPPFGEVITAEEMKALAAYVLELSEKKS